MTKTWENKIGRRIINCVDLCIKIQKWLVGFLVEEDQIIDNETMRIIDSIHIIAKSRNAYYCKNEIIDNYD